MLASPTLTRLAMHMQVSYGGEDAHFISTAGGGALGVADGVGGWQESGVNPAGVHVVNAFLGKSTSSHAEAVQDFFFQGNFVSRASQPTQPKGTPSQRGLVNDVWPVCFSRSSYAEFQHLHCDDMNHEPLLSLLLPSQLAVIAPCRVLPHVHAPGAFIP